MADKTAIEWTDATWNPIVGCSVLSPGCTNCYAMRHAARMARMGVRHYEDLTADTKAGPVWNGTVRRAPDNIMMQPLRWARPRKVFVNSMSDLFHPGVPFEVVDLVFGIMALCPQHVFQVLTKRPDRMRSWFAQPRHRPAVVEVTAAAYVDLPEIAAYKPFDAAEAAGLASRGWPLPNVWLGVSVEDQKRAADRIPDLRACPAAVRFVSCEPLLERVMLTSIDMGDRVTLDALRGTEHFGGPSGSYYETPAINRLDWVIAGGESGPAARPVDPDWIRSLRDQCAFADVPFFFKQWGEHDERGAAIGKRRAGNVLDGQMHSEMPA